MLYIALPHMQIVLLIVIAIFIALFYALSSKTSKKYVEGARLVVLVDNNPQKQGLRTAWGLSVYVEANGMRLLFDTGPEPAVLKVNAEELGVDLSKVDFVVISHSHGDHTNGLKLLASIKPGIVVYIPPDEGLERYVRSLGLRPVQVNSTLEIAGGIYVVKPLYGPPIEEALAIETSGGLIIVVGCSHPGIVNVVRQAARDIGARPYIVLGGFHMAGATPQEVQGVISQLLEMGVERIYPLHCSGEAIRSYLYGESYRGGGVGLEIIQDVVND